VVDGVIVAVLPPRMWGPCSVPSMALVTSVRLWKAEAGLCCGRRRHRYGRAGNVDMDDVAGAADSASIGAVVLSIVDVEELTGPADIVGGRGNRWRSRCAR